MVQYDNYRPSYERARARTLGGVLIRDMPPPVVRFIIRRPEFLVCLFLFMALRNSGYVVPDITGGYPVLRIPYSFRPVPGTVVRNPYRPVRIRQVSESYR